MIKYQYQTLIIPAVELTDKLNEKGNKGWRLVNIRPVSFDIEEVKSNLIRYECIFEKIIY